MTGECYQRSPAENKNLYTVLSIAQRGEKVNIDDIVADLTQELQNLEDMKTQITECQERIRQAICECEMIKEALPDAES